MLEQSADSEAVHDEDEMDLSGLYWTPPGEMQREDAHRNLAEAIAGRRPDQVKLFSASAFEIPSAFPAGFFDVAIDMATHEACGVYRAYRDNNDYATKPEWFSRKLKALEEGIGACSWFCDPSAPWQKGTVENSNKRIRRFLPGATDLAVVSQRDPPHASCQRPRKCLGYRTPTEVFMAHLHEDR